MYLVVIAGASSRSTQEVQELLGLLWAGALQPLVFGLAGASIRFDALPVHLGLKALAVAAIGKNWPQLPNLSCVQKQLHAVSSRVPGMGCACMHYALCSFCACVHAL